MKTLSDITRDGVSAFASGGSAIGDPNDPIATASSVASVAAGSTLGLEQGLLAAAGQVGQTILAVPYVFYEGSEGPSPNHKAQVTSLGAGNALFVYANGADFQNGVIQEGPVFLEDGEIYVIENVQAGSIVTFTQGGYGFCQQRIGNNESPMPMMSYALNTQDTFCFAFRSSQTYDPGGDSNNQGFIHVVNGPLANTVTLFDSSGAVVEGQEDIPLTPWQYHRLFTSGNGEYRIKSKDPIMLAINANMGVNTPAFFDSRLILDVTNDGVSWPRSGFISALFPNTRIINYVNDLTGIGPSPQLTVNPGTPLDWDAAGTTGASDVDYEPRGATRLRASGFVTANSGADSSGTESSPLCPVSTFTQKIALPLHIRNAGDGGNNGIAIASIYTGTARVYEWNPATGAAEIVTFNGPDGLPTTDVKLIRRNGSASEFIASTPAHQLHPASALISAQGAGGTDSGAYDLLGDFNGGYVEVDVPSMVVFNAEQNENGGTEHRYRGTSGDAVIGIHSDDDEQLSYGITPNDIRAQIQRGSDGLLYRREILAGGAVSWVVA